MLENNINIKDIFANEDFQKLQDDLSASIGLAIIVVDFMGTPITKHSFCSDFCKSVRKNKKFQFICERCDSRGGLEAVRSKNAYIYLCHAGLVDLAIPIVFNETYLGAFMAGQVLLSNQEDISKLETIYYNTDSVFLKNENQELYGRLPTMTLKEVIAKSNVLSFICKLMLENEIIKSSNKKLVTSGSPIQDYNKNHVLKPIYEYIDRNLYGNLSLNEISAVCNLSPNYLSRLFKKYESVSFKYYVNKKRIEHAKKLLKSTDMSINEIAFKLGYNDCSYFNKVFKNMETVTPSEFRNK